MKRQWIRGALVVACALVLSACGGDDGSPPSGVTPPPPVSPPAAPLPAIGAEGGTVTEPGGASVVVPAGALSDLVTIRIAKDSTGAPALPQGLTAGGDIYAITPHGAVFDAPVEVRIPVPASPLRSNARWSIAKAEPGGEWSVLLDVTQKDGMLVAPVQSFSYFLPVQIVYQLTPVAPEPLQVRFNLGGCIAQAGTGGSPSSCQYMDGPVTALVSWTVTGTALPGSCTPQTASLLVRFGSEPERSVPLVSGSAQPVLYPFNGGLRLRLSCGYQFHSEYRVGFNGSGTYPAIRAVQAPFRLQVLEGERANIQHVFTGGAAKGNTNGTYATPTATDRAVVDWERSDDGGRSWRIVARSYQHEADRGPFGAGTPEWLYWGVRHGFDVKPEDRNARFRSIACYTPPDAAAPPCVGRSTELIVLQQSALPMIVSAPRSVLVKTGQTASFSATASGAPAPTLQWQMRDANSNGAWSDVTSGTGATTGNYTTAALTLADNGREYRVMATNSVSTTASAPVTVSVSDLDVAPTVTTHPASLGVTAGNDAVFAIAARGTEALSYQWFFNGNAITGANSPVLRLAAVAAAQAGSYTVRVSNAAGEATSNAAVLTVGNAAAAAPLIVTQPVAVTVNAGNTATFAVGATGSARLAYQWLKNGQPINGATSAFHSIAAVAVGDVGNYSVQITNGEGSGVTSTAAALIVNPTAQPAPVVITSQPSPQVQAPGGSATFAVAATGTGPLAYQWLKDGTPLVGATSAVLLVGNVSSNEAGSYAVTVSNGISTVTSNGAALIVLGAPAITTQPAGASATEGATATFSVSASGASLRYQWTKNGVAIAGATASSYTTPALTLADSGAVYGVIVYNGAGLVISGPAVLTVTQKVTIAWGTPALVAGGGDFGEPAAAIDDAGNAAALFVTNTGRIMASSGRVGTAWTAPTFIDAGVPGYRAGFTPQLASAPSGSTVAAWGYQSTTGWGVAAVRGSMAGGWGTPASVSDGFTGDLPALAMDEQGRAVVLYEINSRIYARFSQDAGSPWSAPVDIVTAAGGPSGGVPSVAVNSVGQGFVVYSEQGRSIVALPINLATSSFGAPARFAGNFVADARIAVNESGQAALVYYESMVQNYDARAVLYSPATGWSAPVSMDVDVPFFARDLAVSIDGSGRVVAAWGKQAITVPGGAFMNTVYGNVFTPGIGWGTAVLLADPAADDVEGIQIVASRGGRFIVTWPEYDAKLAITKMVARVFDGDWQPPATIQTALAHGWVGSTPLRTRSLAISPTKGYALQLWLQDVPNTANSEVMGNFLQ